MISISIFYFDGHRLVDATTVEEGDLLDAIDLASDDADGRRVEIWTDRGRMGELGDRLATGQGTSTVSTASPAISG